MEELDVSAEGAVDTFDLAAIERKFFSGRQLDESRLQDYYNQNKRNLADVFEALVDQYEDNACLFNVPAGVTHATVGSRTLSYKQVDEVSNQLAHWVLENSSELMGGTSPSTAPTSPSTPMDWPPSLHSHGRAPLVLSTGSVVGLLMENDTAYITTWLSLVKCGFTVALLNTYTQGMSLHQAITMAGCHVVFASTTLLPSLRQTYRYCEDAAYILTVVVCEPHARPVSNAKAILPPLPTDYVNEIVLGSATPPVHSYSTARLPTCVRTGSAWETTCFVIYTSGTTGKSKAAKFSHRRVFGAGLTWSRHMLLGATDCVYVALPLYHGNGGIMAIASAWMVGASVGIRRKFSVSCFLSDIRQYQCTAMFYIGELWRYLLRYEKQSDDSSNPLRVVAGNGLRPSTWRAIQQRYAIELIVEHYGQTEMPAALPMINSYGICGACGFIPNKLTGTQTHELLIAYDVALDQPIRLDNGFCKEAEWDETTQRRRGEAIVKIEGEYSGYMDKASSERAVYRNVFEVGDVWYHSGDILEVDINGFYYFVDRGGDSFRYKGENVSTSEVGECLSQHPLVKEANVYGVSLFGSDVSAERVGMASITYAYSIPIKAFLVTFHKWVYETLPMYAHPLFLRIKRLDNEKTSTLKFIKHTAIMEGYNPLHSCFARTLGAAEAGEGDALFFDDPTVKAYVPLTEALYKRIQEGFYKL